MGKALDRAGQVEQARRYLEAVGRPRLVMTLIVALTIAAGALASVVLVDLGVRPMAVRYPLAVGVAYAALLAQLWGWLRGQVASRPITDDPEGLFVAGMAGAGSAALADKLAEKASKKPRGSAGTTSGLDGLGNLGDLGDAPGCLSILILLAILVTAAVSLYLVVTSPLILAELLVDGALLGTLTRAVGPGAMARGLRSVVRRTWVAAVVTAVAFGLIGWGIGAVAPGAHTIGEAIAIDSGR